MRSAGLNRQAVSQVYEELQQCHGVVHGDNAIGIALRIDALLCAQFYGTANRLVQQNGIRQIHIAVQIDIAVQSRRVNRNGGHRCCGGFFRGSGRLFGGLGCCAVRGCCGSSSFRSRFPGGFRSNRCGRGLLGCLGGGWVTTGGVSICWNFAPRML